VAAAAAPAAARRSANTHFSTVSVFTVGDDLGATEHGQITIHSSRDRELTATIATVAAPNEDAVVRATTAPPRTGLHADVAARPAGDELAPKSVDAAAIAASTAVAASAAANLVWRGKREPAGHPLSWQKRHRARDREVALDVDCHGVIHTPRDRELKGLAIRQHEVFSAVERHRDAPLFGRADVGDDTTDVSFTRCGHVDGREAPTVKGR